MSNQYFEELNSYVERFETDSLTKNYNANGLSFLYQFDYGDDILLRINGTMKLLWAIIIRSKDHDHIKISPIYLLDGISEEIIQGYIDNPILEDEYQYLISNMKFLAGYDVIDNSPLNSWDNYLAQLDER